MSETFKADQLKHALKQGNNCQFIEKGRLLDSLDLNTGFEAIQKLKDLHPTSKFLKEGTKDSKNKIEIVNQKPAKQSFQKLVKESDLRDSLDEDDWKDFENIDPPENAKKEPNSDDSCDFERDEKDDTNWLQQSMRESISNWK